MKTTSASQFLNDHPFSKLISSQANPAIVRITQYLRDTRQQDAPQKLVYTPAEKYHLAVLMRTAPLFTVAHTLELCCSVIAKRPDGRLPPAGRVTEHEWLEYHFGYFIVLLTSTFDIALLLTNEVFCLGNSEKNCKADTIKQNAFVTSTPVKRTLDVLDKELDRYRQMRTSHVHAGKPPDIGKLVGSDSLGELMSLSKLASFEKYTHEPLIPSEVLRMFFKNQSKDLSAYMRKEVTKFSILIGNVLGELQPVFARRAADLVR